MRCRKWDEQFFIIEDNIFKFLMCSIPHLRNDIPVTINFDHQ